VETVAMLFTHGMRWACI